MRTRVVLLLGLCSLSYASLCGTLLGNRVSDADAKLITEKHNEFRKLIANGAVPGQPRGVNLKRLRYDKQLAAAAQKIANSCKFAHQAVQDGRWHAVGQNIYMLQSTNSNSESNWPGAIQGWFNEHTNYRFGTCCESGPKETGHYTQVVWADTEAVGCGYTYFKTNESFQYHKLYVCNYGPAGNYVGRQPYQTGTKGCENLC